MPLIEPGTDVTTILYVDCLCGHRSQNYANHYRHVVTDCEIHRCQYCFTVVQGGPIADDRFEDPETHMCPHQRLRELERGINAT